VHAHVAPDRVRELAHDVLELGVREQHVHVARAAPEHEVAHRSADQVHAPATPLRHAHEPAQRARMRTELGEEALAELQGPAAGLEALDQIADEPRLAGYQPFWAARAELLARGGQGQAANQAYERAIALEIDPAVRRFLERRRAQLTARAP